jgi:hypothetical protein
MRRSLAAGVLSAVVTMSIAESATPAGATTPVREPLELPSELVLAAGDFCGFEILVTWPVNNEVATTFFDAEGNVDRVLVTGALQVTFENQENGETLTLNIPGSGVIIDNELTYRGRNVIFPVEGQLDLVSGRVVVMVDSEGFQHPVELAGRTTDVCTLLA